MHEYVGNLHSHSRYSDGHGEYEDIARAAIRAGLDFVIVTDHNIWVGGIDGYRYLNRDQVLLLTGEEIHDPNREPQKNHLLVFETQAELADHSSDPQELIDQTEALGGCSFIAHPEDPAAPAVGEPDLSWVDWEVERFTGLEIWNFMSEFKSHLGSWAQAFYYAYNPNSAIKGPFEGVLDRWDRLLASGKTVVAIGGADAHATPYQVGPIRRVIFPYEYLFRAVNTHVLMNDPLTGQLDLDRRRLFGAIQAGRCYVANNLLAPARGFRFRAHGDHGEAIMGERIHLRLGITLQLHIPTTADARLLRDGVEIAAWEDIETAVLTVHEPGAYRAEIFHLGSGRQRGWIYSNPIYVHK